MWRRLSGLWTQLNIWAHHKTNRWLWPQRMQETWWTQWQCNDPWAGTHRCPPEMRDTLFKTAGKLKSWLKTTLVKVHPYLQDTRNPQNSRCATDSKNKQLLPLEKPYQFVIKFIHEAGHHHFNHRKLAKEISVTIYLWIAANNSMFISHCNVFPIVYLTVQSKAEQHEEEHHSPELRYWHVGKGLWVNNKNQSWTWIHKHRERLH